MVQAYSSGFICIGAPKSATTWLYQNLNRHPDVLRLPIKEIRYFGGTSLPLVLSRSLSQQRTRALGLLAKRLAGSRDRDSRREFAWLLRFAMGRRNDDWYRSLLRPAPGKLVGDFSPQYAIAGADAIAHAAAAVPGAKIVYLIRNPVDRCLSHVAMRFRSRYRKDIADWNDPRVDIIAKAPDLLAHGDYDANIARWQNAFPAVHIGFFDDIEATPDAVLADVIAFLGLAPIDMGSEKSAGRIAAGRYPAPPSALKARLAKQYLDKVERLHARLAHPRTRAWLDELRSF